MKPYYDYKGITIYHGDCQEILPELDHVDLILTDPPYGVELQYDIYIDTENNWFNLLNDMIPKMKQKASMCILPCCRIKALPWLYNNFPPDWLICWYKGSTGHRSAIGFNDWEPLLIYGRTTKIMHDYLAVHNNEKMGNYGHPCPKPLTWASHLLAKACPDNGTVIDPFMGSGTVLRAAKDLKMKAIGIDISEKYCEIAAKRLSQEVLF